MKPLKRTFPTFINELPFFYLSFMNVDFMVNREAQLVKGCHFFVEFSGMCGVPAAVVEPKVDHFMKKCVREYLRAVHEIAAVQPDHSMKQISLAKTRFHSSR